MPRRRTPIAKLGHVAANTTDLEESLWFFRDVMGLKVTERTDDAAYLRGTRDWEHHSLALEETGERGVDHVAFRTTTAEDLEALAERFEADGMAVTRQPPGLEPGIGESVRVEAFGHPYEFYHDVDKPDAPEGERSGLLNRLYDETQANRVAPRRIDHVHVNDPGENADAHADWLQEALGFQLNERYQKTDGEYWGWWFAVTALPHDIAIHREPTDANTQFHHVAYHLDSLQDLWSAADLCAENGLEINNRSDSPAMHAITRADCMYVIDPASGLRLELFAGPGYLNFEPDWEPLEWKEETIGGATNHQWVGGGPTWDGIDYAGATAEAAARSDDD